MDVMALSLRITSEGFQQAFRDLSVLDQQGRQVAQSLNRMTTVASQPFERMSQGGIILAGSAARAEQAVRRTTATTVTLGQRVTQSAGLVGRFGGALEGLARAGTTSGGALRGVLNVGSGIASMFGPVGAAVGALSFFGLTAARIFQRTKEEAQALGRSLDATFRSLLAPGTSTAQVSQALITLGAGDPTLEDTPENRARRLGLVGLERRRDELERAIADLRTQLTGRTGAAAQALGAGGVASTTGEDSLNTLLTEQKSILASLTEMQKTRGDLHQRLVDVATTEVDILQTRERIEKEAEQRKIAEEARRISALARENLRGGLDAILGNRIATRDVGGAGLMRLLGITAPGGQLRLEVPVLVAPKVEIDPKGIGQALLDMVEQMRSVLEGALEGTLESVFTQIGQGANVFDALREGLLSGMGSIMIELGKQAIVLGTMMQGLLAAIRAMSPGAQIAIGVALIAAGSLLRGLSSGMGSRAVGGAGGGGRSSTRGFADITRTTVPGSGASQAASIQPRAFIQVGPNFGWGPDLDRKVKESVDRASRRQIGD